ncbi:MAG: NAD-dependent epimerase/dehydratase family protein [Chloroflexaceae bacterium]|nr:NAD-dependent epimerase/dehydratase family protein [Chloroflexaceae bacterium]
MLARLKQVAVGDRRSYLMAFLQEKIAEVLGLNSGEQPDPQKGLFEMGMDSLMAIELVSFIEAHLQARFSMLEILEANNIETLVEVLLRQVFPEVAPSEVACNVLSLETEAVLEENIVPKEPFVEQEKTKAVFLTGASGFLGAFLLRELLERTEATIYCLVRAGNILSGQLKLEENLKNYQIWQTNYAARIVPVIGDLSQPYLGLEPEEFDKLAQIIEVIYHNGAVLNFVYPYSILKPTNVLGTKEILKLACQFQTKPLHYVSTDAVFDSCAYFDREVKESEPIAYTQGLDLGYTQSKWVAETLVTIARDRGLPVTIYRPPLIAGDSHTGIWNTNDFTCRFIKGCIQMGKMPDMNCELAIVPVNYVSQAIISLSLEKTSSGRAFHLNNPHAPNWSEVVKWINNLGYTVQQVPYQTWEVELITTSSYSNNVLNSLIPFFLKKWSQEQLNFAEFGQRRVRLSCQETVKELAKSNIACPSVNFDLLGTYFSYFIRDGFLDSHLKLSIKT